MMVTSKYFLNIFVGQIDEVVILCADTRLTVGHIRAMLKDDSRELDQTMRRWTLSQFTFKIPKNPIHYLPGDEISGIKRLCTDSKNLEDVAQSVLLGDLFDEQPRPDNIQIIVELPKDLEKQAERVFRSEVVRSLCEGHDFRVNSIHSLYQRPHVWSTSRNDHKSVYLKFVDKTSGSKEVDILRHLSTISSPNNHMINPIDFWPVEEGTIIPMLDGGMYITGFPNPIYGFTLFSLARQLIEGLSFMHEHNIAHLDIQPANVVVHHHTGWLTIIDCSASVRFKSADDLLHGFAGTPGWTAPEVGVTDYYPMRADVWSCGKLIERISTACTGKSAHLGIHRQFLLDTVCKLLMNDDPLKRPSLADIARRLLKVPTYEHADGSTYSRFSTKVDDDSDSDFGTYDWTKPRRKTTLSIPGLGPVI